MYCLLCHAKIPRLRAWRTKSEFCSDEHAEAYKNQMLDRLMVNEPESAEQSDKRLLPLQAGAQPASRAETASPLQGSQPSEGERIFLAASSAPQRSGNVLGLGDSSALAPPSAGSSPKEQSAEQALAALRELAESAQRSKGQPNSDAGLASRPSASEPADEPTLRQPMAGGSEDPFDELRRLASLAESEDAPETAEPAEEEELDVVARASALERLMQESTPSQPDELPESKLDELMRGEQESEEVSDLVNRLTEDAARPVTEPLAAAPPFPEEVSEPAMSAQQAEEVSEEALAPMAGDAGLEAVGEQVTQAAETIEAEAVAGQPEASEPSRANVVPFPGEPREEAAKDDTPAAAGADAAAAVGPASKDPGRGKKRTGIPPPAKVALEPLLDLFAAEYRYPAQQESRNGWTDFVARVQGDRVSLKDVNGVIQTQSVLSYPAGPTPASLKSSADLDLALFSTLPGVADAPSFDVERVDAAITAFEAACVHPELVFLNFALSTSQAGGLVDVSGAISRNMSASGLNSLQWPGLEQQVAEPRFSPSVPANFLARCEDLSLSTDVDLFAGDLVFAAASMSERSTFSGPAIEGPAKLSGPRLGTAFPDRLFAEAGHADEARGQGWTAGQLVGADPRGHDSSAAEFPPMDGTGGSRSMQESLRRAGIFEPVLETKRPMDRDLADFV